MVTMIAAQIAMRGQLPSQTAETEQLALSWLAIQIEPD
jgi:hypothetical protein